MEICKNCGLTQCPRRCLDAKKKTEKFLEMDKWRAKQRAKQYVEKKNDNYKRACEFRKLKSNIQKHKDMWDKFTEKLGSEIDIEADVELFSNSQEFDNMVDEHRIGIIKVLSGLDGAPDWCRIEIEDEEL